MKLSTLRGIAAIYTAVAGPAFIFAPKAIGVGAVPADASAVLNAYVRLFGCPLLGITVLDRTARNSEPSTARNAILLGNIFGFGATAVVDVRGLFSGARQLQMAFAVIHLIFAMAFIVAWRKSTAANNV
jgi:hypothetical protein